MVVGGVFMLLEVTTQTNALVDKYTNPANLCIVDECRNHNPYLTTSKIEHAIRIHYNNQSFVIKAAVHWV